MPTGLLKYKKTQYSNTTENSRSRIGIELRRRRRLRRRQYVTKGHVHVNSDDKFKPFVFCIHGAIDGYSRRILWLDLGPPNNNPIVLFVYHFVEVVRCDCETENCRVRAVQRFIRRDGLDNFGATSGQL